jgi:hypothetical protein
MIPRSFVAVLALFCSTAAGCGSCGASALCTFKGKINDPSNRTMRRSLMSSGVAEFCKQMLAHNAPLRMSNDTPVIGRYYPQTCTQRELDNGDLHVDFTGIGYGYTNLSKKLTFSMAGGVDYNQDFLVTDDPCTIYGYFRVRRITASDFRTRLVENPVAGFANQLTGLGDRFGQQLVSDKLSQGFTVIHDDSGDDVGFGMVELGKRPFHPFDVHGTSRMTYENARTEVHQGERDFIGPFEVDSSGRALYFTADLDGAPRSTFWSCGRKKETPLCVFITTTPNPARWRALRSAGGCSKQARVCSNRFRFRGGCTTWCWTILPPRGP